MLLTFTLSPSHHFNMFWHIFERIDKPVHIITINNCHFSDNSWRGTVASSGENNSLQVLGIKNVFSSGTFLKFLSEIKNKFILRSDRNDACFSNSSRYPSSVEMEAKLPFPSLPTTLYCTTDETQILSSLQRKYALFPLKQNSPVLPLNNSNYLTIHTLRVSLCNASAILSIFFPEVSKYFEQLLQYRLVSLFYYLQITEIRIINTAKRLYVFWSQNRPLFRLLRSINTVADFQV